MPYHTPRPRPLRPLDDAPAVPTVPERRLVFAILHRALLDALRRPATRAWFASPACAELCDLVDLPAGTLRRVLEEQPERVKRWWTSVQ